MRRSTAFQRAQQMALLLALVIPGLAFGAPAFVTGPAEGTPTEVALGYLDANKGELGLVASDVNDLVVRDQYTSSHNGVTHVYLQQRLGGVEVVNAIFNVNVMQDGRVLSFGNRFVKDLSQAVNAVSPRILPEDAVAGAAEHLGAAFDRAELHTLENLGGPALEVRFNGAGLSRDDIPARLMYLPTLHGEGPVRLVWSLVIRELEGSNWWNMFVDAETGVVLEKFNWTVNERGRRATARAQSTGLVRTDVEEVAEGPCTTNCYEVFATPKESPDDGGLTVESDPADATASPFGWHDTDGSAGAEFTDTRGNNVEAQTDLNANNTFGPPDVRSEGGASLDFSEPLDLGMQPDTYQEFAVLNLFYWNNIMHDISYQYGFDPVSGNFQENTYGGGGAGGDPVQADAQDGSGTNNANFGTPADGFDPRMQMFVWTNPNNAILDVNSPGTIAGDYSASHPTDWSGSLTPSTTADLEEVDDGTALPSQGCEDLVGFTPGNIALIDRGSCEFGTKALKAQNAGAAGAVIVNDQQLPNGTIVMGAGVDGASVTIPAIMIGNADGATIRAELPGVNVTLTEPAGGAINRDSDLDAGVIAHEYGHGISNRLTGGPANVGCLQHGEQAGEGWSDWWTLSLFPLPGDTETTNRGVGNYVSFLPITGPGIRSFPYTTDMGVNPQTYGDVEDAPLINGSPSPHFIGAIWAEMLWEMYWNLVNKHGFDADLYTGGGGNNLAIQLVIDGMKIQQCVPTFVHARDAIVAADVANNSGDNACEIWHAFAKRGLGFSATAGGPGHTDQVEAFDLPAEVPSNCLGALFADGFETGDTSRWSVTVD